MDDSRREIISLARAFLDSPQVQHQDDVAKRKFLLEKGLTEPEINNLLLEARPQVPPRTYPQLPPSRLPNLLMGLARIVSWMTGGSLLLIFIYHRFLLPRISQTYQARQSLQKHHISLVQKLAATLTSFKETREQSLENFPRSSCIHEPLPFRSYNSVEEITKESERQKLGSKNLPLVSLLRCAIAEHGEHPTTEQIFQLLETKVPSLTSAEASGLQERLWETLSTHPSFKSAPESTSQDTRQTPSSLTWSYVAPNDPAPSPLLSSLTSLVEVLPKNVAAKQSPFQHTMQSLSELTGFVSAQIYVPYRPSGLGGSMNAATDELKKEIRALKGLVLNRRTFMASIPRAPTPTD